MKPTLMLRMLSAGEGGACSHLPSPFKKITRSKDEQGSC